MSNPRRSPQQTSLPRNSKRGSGYSAPVIGMKALREF